MSISDLFTRYRSCTCVSASVLDISREKISEPASIVNGLRLSKRLQTLKWWKSVQQFQLDIRVRQKCPFLSMSYTKKTKLTGKPGEPLVGFGNRFLLWHFWKWILSCWRIITQGLCHAHCNGLKTICVERHSRWTLSTKRWAVLPVPGWPAMSTALPAIFSSWSWSETLEMSNRQKMQKQKNPPVKKLSDRNSTCSKSVPTWSISTNAINLIGAPGPESWTKSLQPHAWKKLHVLDYYRSHSRLRVKLTCDSEFYVDNTIIHHCTLFRLVFSWKASEVDLVFVMFRTPIKLLCS